VVRREESSAASLREELSSGAAQRNASAWLDVAAADCTKRRVAKEPQRLGLSEARMQFPSIVDAATEGARFVVTRHGKDRCAIVSMEDLQRLIELKQEQAKRRR
jgi:prevent-host-death family protein